jgi:Uma2 family endonuclease
MTSDEFIAWAMDQPEGERYELVNGEIYGMAPERSIHVLAKFRIARRLAEAVEAAGLECTVYPDGMGVKVDESTRYEPDALVRCGPPMPDDTLTVLDPIIVVEVLSPSTKAVDTGAKFADYFRIPSLRHYLIVRPDTGVIVHHARDAAGAIASRIVSDGALTLDPPGIELRDLLPPR